MNDFINCVFEFGGGILLIVNCFRLYKDKEIKGVSISVTAFFMAWGYWNLYYYPSLNQWWSFIGGILIVAANTVWVGMAIYYARR
jgi:uncharacterized membrane protein YfcA